MSSWNDPWDKPLWQRNAEDNMSLRHEIEKNYDAANNHLQTTTDFNMGNEDSFGENLSGLSNMGENDNFLLPQTDDFSRIWSQTLPANHNQRNDLKDFSKPVQEQNSGFASYEQNSNPMAFASQRPANNAENSQSNPLLQIMGAINDMGKNYFDMKKDRTKKADDYFHCKANFEAARRGDYGAKTAKWLGDKKEDFDYYYNQIWKGLSQEEALKDEMHDKNVNQIGRQLAKNKLYSNSKEACRPYRVRGINDKY